MAVHKHSVLDSNPPIFGRIGVHQDISSTANLFEARLWL